MKISLYVPAWPPGQSANGIVTYAATLVPALRRLGHDVYILTSYFLDSAPDEYTIDLRSIDIQPSIFARLIGRLSPERFIYDQFTTRLTIALSQLKKEKDIDIFEIEDSFGWGLRLAEKNIVPVTIRLHGPWFLNGRFGHNAGTMRTRIAREGQALAVASLVTSPSAAVLSEVQYFYATPLKHARVIPNPINISPDSARWTLGLSDTRRILFVGRFDRRKGGDLIISAFINLAQLYPDLRLTFVGPDDGIVDSRNGSRVLFNEHPIPSAVRARIDFLGQQSSSQIANLRTKHLFTIVASQFEILPYSVLEAMSYGSPIIASKVGGIPELIRHEENGLLFESGNVSALVSACRRLIEDNALAAKLGARARVDCAGTYNPLLVAEQTIAAYQTVFHSS
ncbi:MULTISPECIES: glycosyltransferase family 4 protein [unclassified Bradyrhizobium]|uniref:glycosyltransferase family 4 protein n=1 Tax=unclassified Bradyrhizobium TaxID=2631580 RepID=UPI0029166528|nr:MULTISPECIES: glycosyltransferase family 4 protein [unclassified Bradyrhizobium]